MHTYQAYHRGRRKHLVKAVDKDGRESESSQEITVVVK